MQHYAACHLGLHSLVTHLFIYSIQRVNILEPITFLPLPPCMMGNFLVTVSSSLDPDQVGLSVGPDLVPI